MKRYTSVWFTIALTTSLPFPLWAQDTQPQAGDQEAEQPQTESKVETQTEVQAPTPPDSSAASAATTEAPNPSEEPPPADASTAVQTAPPSPESSSEASAPSKTPAPRSHPLLDRRPSAIFGWQRESDLAPQSKEDGISLRVSAAGGYGSIGRPQGGDGRQRISGLQGLISVDVGGVISRDLIFFGRLGGLTINHASRGDSQDAGNAYVGLIGMGLRYHLMPEDYYASGALSLALMTATGRHGKVDNARPGVGFEFELGKNWPLQAGRLSRSVGLGARFSLVRCGATPSAWFGTAYSLVFSTSFN